MNEISPQTAEQQLFDAVSSGDVEAAQHVLSEEGRDSVEFTGRCFAHAITSGDVEMALFCAHAGFHLNVLDEPALRVRLADPTTSAHALREYLQTYRYCRAQRTYYLPIVQSEQSLEPLAALLADRTSAHHRDESARGADAQGGLTRRDTGELLSLAVRFDVVNLARLLIEAGVPLPADPQDTIPAELRGNGSQTLADNPWIEVLSPHHSDEMLELILEQIAATGERCPIRATWFKLHFREEGFARKLARIVPDSESRLCENVPATLLTLATGGYAHALSCALAWPEAADVDLEPALAAAQSENHLECAALILGRMQSASPTLEALDWF